VRKRFTVSVPERIFEKMETWRDYFNYSGIFQIAVAEEIEKKELFLIKSKEQKPVKEIFENGKFETPEEQYLTGKEMGFAYARTASYPEIKRYERYLKGWNEGDRETIEEFHRDLDLILLLDRLGLATLKVESSRKDHDSITIGYHFDMGFMTGIMEFIQEECSSLEVGRLALKRNEEIELPYSPNRKKLFEISPKLKESVGFYLMLNEIWDAVPEKKKKVESHPDKYLLPQPKGRGRPSSKRKGGK
jgi:hypothetical protein